MEDALWGVMGLTVGAVTCIVAPLKYAAAVNRRHGWDWTGHHPIGESE